MKTVSKTESPVQAKIREKETEIKATETRITQQRTAITEFEEAIKLIQSDSKYLPLPGQLLPYDQLTQLLAQQTSDAERLAKLTTAQQALDQCRTALNADEQMLAGLRKHLEVLRLDDEWQQKYEDVAPLYLSAFPLLSPAEEREQKLQDLQTELFANREILEQATEWVNAAPNAKPKYLVVAPYDKPYFVVESMPKRITALEQQLEALVEAVVIPSVEYEQQFRQFVRARVSIQKPLDKLLKIQAEYQTALQEFSKVHATVADTIHLDLFSVGLQKTFSVDADNVIHHK